MIARILLLVFLCMLSRAQALAQTDAPQTNGEARKGANDGRPTMGSIPKFDHTPGAQNSIPSPNSPPNSNFVPPAKPAGAPPQSR